VIDLAARLIGTDRSQWIGGSDAAAVLKVSPWSTPLDCYLEKTGQAVKVIDPAREKLFKRGKRLEPIVVDMLIEDYGVKVTKRSTPAIPNRYVDPQHDFLAVEIDFEWEVQQADIDRWALDQALLGTTQSGEVKTVHHFAAAKFGEADTDEIPVEYAAQGMDGLMVTGRQICLFAVLVGADNLTTYILKRDNETIAAMRPVLVGFWKNNVLAGVPPDPVNLPDVTKLLMRRPAIQVEASAEAIAWLAEFEAAKAQMRVAAEIAEEMKFLIGKFMLGEDAIVRPVGARGGKYPVEPTAAAKAIAHELTIDTEPALVINLQRQTRIDTAKVQKDYPEVASACSYDLRFFKFGKPPKPKKAKRR
jgi:predicted phage-related endonuclease